MPLRHGTQGALVCFVLPAAVDAGGGCQVGMVAGSGGEESDPAEWPWQDTTDGVMDHLALFPHRSFFSLFAYVAFGDESSFLGPFLLQC